MPKRLHASHFSFDTLDVWMSRWRVFKAQLQNFTKDLPWLSRVWICWSVKNLVSVPLQVQWPTLLRPWSFKPSSCLHRLLRLSHPSRHFSTHQKRGILVGRKVQRKRERRWPSHSRVWRWWRHRHHQWRRTLHETLSIPSSAWTAGRVLSGLPDWHIINGAITMNGHTAATSAPRLSRARLLCSITRGKLSKCSVYTGI